jgi:hypothetical protein
MPYISQGKGMKRIVAAALLVFSAASSALTGITGKVTDIEGTYVPGVVVFQMDTGSSSCPTGTWLKWQKDLENNKAVYSMLMTALTSGRKIAFYVNDNDAACVGQYIHLLVGS